MYALLKGGRDCDGCYPSNKHIQVFFSKKVVDYIVNNQTDGEGIFCYTATLQEATEEEPNATFYYGGLYF